MHQTVVCTYTMLSHNDIAQHWNYIWAYWEKKGTTKRFPHTEDDAIDQILKIISKFVTVRNGDHDSITVVFLATGTDHNIPEYIVLKLLVSLFHRLKRIRVHIVDVAYKNQDAMDAMVAHFVSQFITSGVRFEFTAWDKFPPDDVKADFMMAFNFGDFAREVYPSSDCCHDAWHKLLEIDILDALAKFNFALNNLGAFCAFSCKNQEEGLHLNFNQMQRWFDNFMKLECIRDAWLGALRDKYNVRPITRDYSIPCPINDLDDLVKAMSYRVGSNLTPWRDRGIIEQQVRAIAKSVRRFEIPMQLWS